ncbi:MAG: LysM peptidoglycan-binding domain-containing protein [Algoriphagus sp.]|nr:LysM peptidoglycan-binding domain-containing protein [Algoriphagus sp.]
MAFGLSEVDSIGVERVGDKSYILHQVEPKETLFGISRRYGAPVNDIVSVNEALKQGLKIGQTIKVPFIPKGDLPSGSILHKVAPGETLFSISKFHGVTVDQIKLSNDLKGNDLSVGQSLIIEKSGLAISESKPATQTAAPAQTPQQKPVVQNTPAKEVAVASTAKVEKPAPKQKEVETVKPEQAKTASSQTSNTTPMVPGEWMSHKVKAGETLFSISSQYGAKVEDLITWNALTSNNVKEGQNLKVGRGPAEASKVPVVGTPRVVTNVEEMNVEPTAENTGGYKNIRETGQAERIDGTGGHKKYLVLHRTAPVGTIMRIKNEENDVTIFARVVGTLPETGDNSRLVIKLSQAAFDQLKAVNERFPVEIMY